MGDDSRQHVDLSNHGKDRIVVAVVKTIGVCGGKPRIDGTRLAVWGMESLRRIGCSDREIMEMYPAIKRCDLQAAWEYVESHPEEIDRQITENLITHEKGS